MPRRRRGAIRSLVDTVMARALYRFDRYREAGGLLKMGLAAASQAGNSSLLDCEWQHLAILVATVDIAYAKTEKFFERFRSGWPLHTTS